MSSSTISAGNNREYTLQDGAVTIFSYELMQGVTNTPIQTRALLEFLLAHTEEIETLAHVQEQQEHQARHPRSIDQRIHDLFT